jgi:acyl-CoA thioester hydrolase
MQAICFDFFVFYRTIAPYLPLNAWSRNMPVENNTTPFYQCELDIRVTDLNYGNHLCHTKLLALVHQARLQWLKGAGFEELNIGGVGLIVSNLSAKYLSEGFIGDRLSFALSLQELKKARFAVHHDIANVQTGRPVAAVEVGFVCFDYETRKPVGMSEELRALLIA